MKKDVYNAIRLVAYGLILMGTACSQSDVDSPAEDETVSKESAQEVQGNGTVKSSNPGFMDQQIADAVTDLATRTDINADMIKIMQARAVSWGSSALGCPQEGVNYTEAIVPGLLLILEADGSVYRYHGGTTNSLFYCPDERAIAPAYGSGQEVM